MRAKVIIDLENLRYNLEIITKKIPKEKIMAIIKANAYGHGDLEVFDTCYNFGIKFYGVASVDEAIRIRKINKDSRILVLGVTELKDYEFLSENNIDITITCFEEIEYILQNNIKGNYHIAYDTGMGRIGFNENEIEDAIKLLKPCGIFSHLTSADNDYEYTKKQYEKFIKLADKYDIKYKHLLNSFGAENYCSEFKKFDLYRVGILMYGGELNDRYRPVMKFFARVSYVKTLSEDSYIGYSNTYKAKKGNVIATISAGYADGIFRNLSNKSKVYLRGKKYNIIGNICMDQFMILADENVKIGDYVEIFGENIKVSEQAKIAQTISYELLCAVSYRVKRIYKKEDDE